MEKDHQYPEFERKFMEKFDKKVEKFRNVFSTLPKKFLKIIKSTSLSIPLILGNGAIITTGCDVKKTIKVPREEETYNNVEPQIYTENYFYTNYEEICDIDTGEPACDKSLIPYPESGCY